MGGRKPVNTGFCDLARRLSQKDLAWSTGATPKTLLAWESAGMPRNADGSYDLQAVLRWWRERESASTTKSEALEAWRRAKAEHAALDLAVRRKQFYPKEFVEAEWGRVLSIIQDGIRTLANTLPPRLVAVDAKTAHLVLDDAIRGIFGRAGIACAKIRESGAPQTPPKTKTKAKAKAKPKGRKTRKVSQK